MRTYRRLMALILLVVAVVAPPRESAAEEARGPYTACAREIDDIAHHECIMDVAICIPDLGQVERLLKTAYIDPDFDRRRNRPWFDAVFDYQCKAQLSEKLKVLAFFFERGADPNYVRGQRHLLASCLTHSIKRGAPATERVAILELSLRHGFDPNFEDPVRGAVWRSFASMCHEVKVGNDDRVAIRQMVGKLIDAHANLNARTNPGDLTALMQLAFAPSHPNRYATDCVKMVELLLSRGADPKAVDVDGFAAVDWATYYFHARKAGWCTNRVQDASIIHRRAAADKKKIVEALGRVGEAPRVRAPPWKCANR